MKTFKWHSKSETFCRNYGLFGVIIVSLFIIKCIFVYWQIVLNLILFALLNYIIELKLHGILYKASWNKTTYNENPSIFTWLAYSTSISIVGIKFLKLYFIPDHSFVPTYCLSLYVSMILFSLASLVKISILAFKKFNTRQARKGTFGILQRIAMLIRHLIVIPIWIQHFKENQYSFVYVGYVIIKCGIQIWLLWDFKRAFHYFLISNDDILLPIQVDNVKYECVICQGDIKSPIKLKCGHSFCQECIQRWLSKNKICPTCKTEIARSMTMEYEDGFIPSSVVLFSF